MAEPDREEADNEVARAIIRRRDRIEAIPNSPFEGWDTTIFWDGVETYYMTDYDLHTGDHWQTQRPSFRPAKHLLDTIRELVKDAEERQRAQRQASKAQEITPDQTNAEVSDERLREIIAGCDKAAPGPWFTDSAEAGLCVVDNGTEAMWPIKCEWHEGKHIARLDPATVKAIATELLNRRSVTSQASEGEVAYRIAEEGKAWDRCEEYRIPLQKFVDHYPSGINPSLDEAWRSARSILASPVSKRVERLEAVIEAIDAEVFLPPQLQELVQEVLGDRS